MNMAYVTPDKFSPYPRVCDVCGQLRSINTMRKLDGVTWVCDKHTGERTKIMLDLLNAHARPPQTWPNLNAKPQNPEYPSTLEADEGAAFLFIDRQIQAQCRYELVASGQGPYLTAGQAVPAMSWAARYLYGLIVQGTRTLLLPRAKVLLGQAATYLLTRQYGSATGPSPTSTRATDAFFGGVLESGASVFVTEDIAVAGQALLYAYQILRTPTYLAGAKSAASYLRNVQAIGSNGTNYTSRDSAGTARYYTGSLASQVSTVSGFYSNGLFYPSALLALQFWSELETTDGDQSVGATAAVTGFTATPAQLLSTSITDLRACWTEGITDSTTTLVNGLSSTTPREFFNAYPASKANFTTISGTGLWEYADGNAATGTQITSQTFARALSSLYAYEGATSQPTTILTWLRTFTSNEDFETPDDTSDMVLQRATTGDYDPTATLATLLTVRDADNSYAATATNGSSLYDWGAFGLLSSLLAATNMTSFKTSRLGALNVRQRYDDGTRSDGLNYDRIELKGLSGLSYQTGFLINTLGTLAGTTAFTQGSTVGHTPPATGLVFWIKGDSGLVGSGGLASRWNDSSGFGQDLDQFDVIYKPSIGLDTINGIPCLTFPTAGVSDKYLYRTQDMVDRAGAPMTSGARTVLAVVKPKFSAANFGITGGPVFSFYQHSSPSFECLFDLEANFVANGAYIWSSAWRDPASALQATPLTGGSGGPYDGVATLLAWRSTGHPDISFTLNEADKTLTPSTQYPGIGAGARGGFMVGNIDFLGFGLNFQGAIAEVLIWDHALSHDEFTEATGYAANRYADLGLPGVSLAMVNDAVRSAQYSLSFRGAH